MACLMNYTVQCTDVTTGKLGCFIFDTDHWQKTGEFKAVSDVYPNLVSFFDAVPNAERKSGYWERAVK